MQKRDIHKPPFHARVTADDAVPSPPADPFTAGQQSFEPIAGPSTSFASFQGRFGLPASNVHDFNSTSTYTTVDKRQLVPDLPNPHIPNLGQIQRPNQSMPESDTNKLLRERVKLDAWSEEELDSLWIGVRRYGCTNWDTMLQDPKLTFSKYKTPQELAAKWQHEQPKVFESASKLPKPANEPGLFDQMVACRARVSSLGMDYSSRGSMSHPIGIHLGFNEHDPALLPPLMDPISNVNADTKHMPGSYASCDVGCSHANSASTGPQESTSFLPRGSTGKGPSNTSAADSVNLNKLPHWMQNAFRQPPPPPPHVPAAPTLPPSASVVAQSLNLLDGAENSEGRMPSCNILHPGSSWPKDPAVYRKSGFGLHIGARAGVTSGSGAAAGYPPEYLEYLEYLDLNSPLTFGQESKKGSTQEV